MRKTIYSILVDLGCFYSYAIFLLVNEAISSLRGGHDVIGGSWELLLIAPIFAMVGITGMGGLIAIGIIIAVLVIGVKLKQRYPIAIYLWPLLISICSFIGFGLAAKEIVKSLKF